MRRSSGYVAVLLEEARREVEKTDRSAFLGTGLVTTQVRCYAPECAGADGRGRPFFGLHALGEHAEAVHTFDDIRQLLRETIREKYNKQGDYNASPPIPGTWSWIEDLSADWVVFTVEHGEDSTLYQADYEISDSNDVTLGKPVEVVRRTVYDPVT